MTAGRRAPRASARDESFASSPAPVTLYWRSQVRPRPAQARRNPSIPEFFVISVNNISMRFGARVLFEDVTTTFLPGRRYAITGPNGAGKSTFMKILTGEIDSSTGSVTRPKKFGVLRQDQFAFDAYRVVDTVIMGNAPLWDALQQREKLYAIDPDQLTDQDGMRL